MTVNRVRLILLLVGYALLTHPTFLWAAQGIPADAARYQRDLTRNVRLVWGLDAPVATFAAQIHQESRWNANAKSAVGAVGLSQFMPATATWISGVYPQALGENQPKNPAWAMRALATYDRWLWDRVKADSACERMAFALSAYNGGLGYVYRRQKRSADPGRCFDATCDINPGISPPNQRENRDYPRLILTGFEPRYVRAGWGKGVCT